MKNFRLIKKQVDIAPLLNEVNAKAEFWLADTSRQTKVAEQRDTQTIYLRAARKPFPPGVEGRDVHESRRTRYHQHFPVVAKWVEDFAAETGGEIGRVTIVKLLPRGHVLRHYDRGEYYRIRDRYHLVLYSTAGSPLTCGDEKVRMQEGELWWFNNKRHHEAFNESDEPRIHVIFDVLPKGAASPKPPAAAKPAG